MSVKEIYFKLIYLIVSVVVNGVYFDIKLDNKFIKKDFRIHIIQL